MQPLHASKATSLLSSVITCCFIMLVYPPPQLPSVPWIKALVSVGFILQLLYYHFGVFEIEEKLSPTLDTVLTTRIRKVEWGIRVFVLLLSFGLVFGWALLIDSGKTAFAIYLGVLFLAIFICYFVWDGLMLRYLQDRKLKRDVWAFLRTDVLLATASLFLVLTIWKVPDDPGPLPPSALDQTGIIAAHAGFAVLCGVLYIGGVSHYLFFTKPPGRKWIADFCSRFWRGPYQ